jgi:ABC-2 type transport system permease protein
MSRLAVAGYEVRRLLRDRALPVLLCLLLGLSAYAAWNGAAWVHQREAAIDLIKVGEQARVADMRQFVVRNTASLVFPSTQLILPPGVMAALSVGQADAYPFSTYFIHPTLDYSTLFRNVWADIGSPTARAAGRFDLAFVIVFLLPLVIMAATYDLWSRERERGVADMVLSQPVPIGLLLAAKALVRALMVLLPSTTIILGVAAWAGARTPGGLAALAVTVLAYGCFWLAVVTMINVFARRSTEAAIAAGAVWLLIVVMAPSLTLAAVDLAAPPPSEMRFAAELKARLTEITERQTSARAANPTQVRTPASRLPDRLRDIYAERVALDAEIGPMIDAHQQTKDARRHLFDTVRFLLPSVAVQDALDRIAGSDADRAIAFQRQARAAQLERRSVYQNYLDLDAPLTLAEYDDMPGAQFRETAGAFQRGVLADLASLVVATLLILIAARAFRARVATP